MNRRDFWKLVLASSLVSTGLVTFLLRWPMPPPARATFEPPAATAADVPLSEDEKINVRIYEQYSKGVVNIVSTTVEYTWFLQPMARQGVGSGFLADSQGHIVTNYHVIEGAEGLDVTLFDNSKHEAEVVGVDQINDLAVLKIDCPGDLCEPLSLGDSDSLQVGQKVMAIGNPFGLQLTLTTGIVSSLGRRIETRDAIIDEVIQTDAAINPGNSGGPLLNTVGQVVGVNTLIYSRSGDSAGIGFAVPVKTVKRILPDLIKHGKVRRPWLGVRGVYLNRRLARALELPVEDGLLIEEVARGSTLEKAGLRGGNRKVRWRRRYILNIGGDVLHSLDGQVVRDEKTQRFILERKRPGDKVAIVFYRDGRKIEDEIELVGQEERRRFRF